MIPLLDAVIRSSLILSAGLAAAWLLRKQPAALRHWGIAASLALAAAQPAISRMVPSLPLTILGGAGSLADIQGLIERFGIIGASAGSLFVFKGVYRAVLISYPSPTEKMNMIEMARRRAHGA